MEVQFKLTKDDLQEVIRKHFDEHHGIVVSSIDFNLNDQKLLGTKTHTITTVIITGKEK